MRVVQYGVFLLLLAVSVLCACSRSSSPKMAITNKPIDPFEVVTCSCGEPLLNFEQSIDDSCECLGRISSSFETRGLVELRLANANSSKPVKLEISSACGFIGFPREPVIINPKSEVTVRGTIVGSVNKGNTSSVTVASGDFRKEVPVQLPAKSKKAFLLEASSIEILLPFQEESNGVVEREFVWESLSNETPAITDVKLRGVDSACSFSWRRCGGKGNENRFVMTLGFARSIADEIARKMDGKSQIIFSLANCQAKLTLPVSINRQPYFKISPPGLLIDVESEKGEIKRRLRIEYLAVVQDAVLPQFACVSGITGRLVKSDNPYELEISINPSLLPKNEKISAVDVWFDGREKISIPLRVNL